MYTNGLSPSILEDPEVHVSGAQLPFGSGWLYRVSVNGVLKDEINSSVKWSAEELLIVQRGYTESLTGYVFGGVQVEGWFPPEVPEQRPKPRRKRINYGDWRKL